MCFEGTSAERGGGGGRERESERESSEAGGMMGKSELWHRSTTLLSRPSSPAAPALGFVGGARQDETKQTHYAFSNTPRTRFMPFMVTKGTSSPKRSISSFDASMMMSTSVSSSLVTIFTLTVSTRSAFSQ